MPAQLVSIENSRRHRTNAEKAARAVAEKSVERETVRLTPPKYLREDDLAMDYWKKTVKRMRGISLLDDVDTEMLAIYCQMLSRRDRLVRIFDVDPTDPRMLANVQAQERLLIQYADKLGLTPNGRMRLAKKRAEERPVDNNADLFD